MKQQIKLVAVRNVTNIFVRKEPPGQPPKPRGGRFFTVLGMVVWVFILWQVFK